MSGWNRSKWRTLENTAKIFPATSGKKDERVFRLSCQMTEEIWPEKLQKALDRCMEEYTLFLCAAPGTVLELSGRDRTSACSERRV